MLPYIKSRRVLFMILGVLLVLGLMAIGSVAAFLFWGYGLFTTQVQSALNANPVVQEHVGNVDSIETDFTATVDATGSDTFVFRVAGPKGSGVVSAEFESVNSDSEEIRSGTLTTSDGKSYPLLPAELPVANDSADIAAESAVDPNGNADSVIDEDTTND